MSWVEEQSWFGLENLVFDAKISEIDAEEKLELQGVWSTKDGREMKLSQMTETHIRNCIKKCERENWRLWALPFLQQELKKRIR